MQTTLVKTTESNSKNLFDRMMSMRCLTLTINSLFFMLHGVTSLMLIIYPSQNVCFFRNDFKLVKLRSGLEYRNSFYNKINICWLQKYSKYSNFLSYGLQTEFEFAIMSMTISVILLLIINSNHPNLIEKYVFAKNLNFYIKVLQPQCLYIGQ